MLTELQVKNSKPKEKYYMLRDDRGLNLRVDPSGRKYWIFRYWENKKSAISADFYSLSVVTELSSGADFRI